jgi:hypothetical protein
VCQTEGQTSRRGLLNRQACFLFYAPIQMRIQLAIVFVCLREVVLCTKQEACWDVPWAEDTVVIRRYKLRRELFVFSSSLLTKSPCRYLIYCVIKFRFYASWKTIQSISFDLSLCYVLCQPCSRRSLRKRTVGKPKVRIWLAGTGNPYRIYEQLMTSFRPTSYETFKRENTKYWRVQTNIFVSFYAFFTRNAV